MRININHSKWMTGVVAATLLLGAGGVTQAGVLDKIVKGGAISAGVYALAKPLNKFVNSLLLQNNATVEATTKVVPILAVGTGTRVGAAQVAGPRSAVDRVTAVVQGEWEPGDKDRFRFRAMIPVAAFKKGGNNGTVTGVGVSAVVDYDL